MKNILLFLGIILFASCSSDDESSTVQPPVIVTGYTQYGTPMASIPANEDVVIYEVNMRAFSSGGDLQGVTNRLDQIKSLGVNTIWLMPIFPDGEVNSVNSPYAVKDFKAVGAEYGNLSDLRALTDAAHQRNMTVILDWVANHTAWDNPWVTAHPEWYTQDANGNIVIPAGTNWADVADLNFSNQEMRLAMIDAMKYWVLEANIDGFRCDYADGVPYDFWNQAITALDAIPNRQLFYLAEGTRSDHFAAGFDLTYGWDYYGATKNVWNGQSATNIFNTHVAEYTQIPAGKHKIRFTTNHDESAWDASPMTLFNGKQGALAASVHTIFLGGAPLFYTGQEVGKAGTTPFFTNTTMDWNMNPDMLAEYQSMMAFYSSSQAARKGEAMNFSNQNILAFTKTFNGEELLILVNVRNSTNTIALNSDLQGSWTNALTNAAVSLGTDLQLSPYQYLILKN